MHEHLTRPTDFVQRLKSFQQRRTRDQTHELLIEGIRPFLRAVDAGQQINLIVESQTLNRSGIVQKHIRELVRRGVPRVRISPEEFRQFSRTEHASGIAAILQQPWTRPREADPHAGLCWLAAESIRSPGNLGTILRTAEAVGAAGLWCIGESLDPFDPSCVRATMGGLFRLKFVRAPLSEFNRWRERHAVQVVGLSANPTDRWDERRYARPTVLFIGDERSGLSNDALQICSTLAHLPMTGSADSLNVSVATSVVMYELVRQLGTAPRTE